MSNSNDDLNEQPTQMASAGSHEQAGEVNRPGFVRGS